MKADFSLYTFLTSITILGLEIYQTTQQNKPGTSGAVTSEDASTPPDRSSPPARFVIEGEFGPLYADLECPHPSYVNVSPHGATQVPLDSLAELAKLRVAANTQRHILTAANRMPPETSVSRMIAERTRGYMAEDARAVAIDGLPEPKAAQTDPKQTARCLSAPGLRPVTEAPPFRTASELWKYVSTKYANRVGIVLGVGDGHLAADLLRHWTATYVYLVDPYIHIWRGYERAVNVDDKSHQIIYERLRYQFTMAFEGRFMFVRDFSDEFAMTYKKAQGQPAPGFVFVDANPAYDHVRKDIDAWFPLLPAGSLMAGTMYGDPDQTVGVKRAVDEFVERNRLKFWTLQGGLWAVEKTV
jgi:hypothetical protein